MLENIIKLAIEEINKCGEMQYEYREGNEEIQPSIYINSNEEVIFDVSLIQSVTITNGSLILYEDGCITILSPTNWTWHETHV